MLGRLGMNIDECIMAYIELMEFVFGKKSSRLPFDWKFESGSQFDSAKLDDAIKRVITSNGASESDPFNDKAERGCRVWVGS